MAKVERIIKGLPCVFHASRIVIQETDTATPSVSFHSYAKATYPDGSQSKVENSGDNFAISNKRLLEILANNNISVEAFFNSVTLAFEEAQEERRKELENPDTEIKLTVL